MSLYDDIYGTGGATAASSTQEEWTPEKVAAAVRAEALRQKIDPDLSVAVATQESSLNPSRHGDRGKSRGVFHLQEKAAIDAGIDPAMRDDPLTNIKAGVTYLKQKLDQSKGDVPQALSRYNRGTPDYRGIGDPDYVYHVMRHYPGGHPLGKAPDDQDAYQARLNKTFGKGTVPVARRALTAISPGSAEAATPPETRSLYDEIYGGAPSAPAAKQPAAPSAPMQTESSLNPLRKTTDLTIAIEKQTPDAPAPKYPALPVSLTQLAPDMDDDEILERLGYDPAEVKKSKFYKPGNLKAHITDPNSTFGHLADTPLGGIMRGARDPIDALVQMGSRGLSKVGILNNADVSYLDALTKIGEADYQQNWRRGKKVDPTTGEGGMFSDPSRMLGEAGITAGIPAGRAATLARTAGRGALMGGGLAAAQPVFTGGAPGTTGDTFWAQKASQIGTGAIFGGVLAPALEKGVVPAVTKAANYARGRAMPAVAQHRLELEQRFGVRLGYQDVAESRIPGQVSQALENVPLTGFGAHRVGQHEDTRRAITRYQGDLQTALRNTPWRDLPAVQAAAARGGRLGNEARGLLDEIRAVGNDPHRTIQASSKLNLFQDRMQSERNYSRVERLAAPLGNMRPNQAIARIDDMLAQYEKDPLPSAEVKREVLGALSRVKGEISPTAAQPQPSMGVRNPLTGRLQAQPPTQATNLPDTTYSRMRQLRSDIGTIQREASTPAVARAMGEVKSALEGDMRDFALKSGRRDLVRAQQVADRFHYARVIRYRGQALAKAAEKDMPDEIYNKFTRQGRDRAQYFYRGLDPKGQAAVRAGMVEEAYQKATANRQPGTFDSGAFAGEMQRHQKATNVFFRGPQRDYLHGFTEVMQLARRGGEYVDRPPSAGSRLLVGGGALGLGAVGGWPLLGKVLVTSQGLRALWLTDAGRNFLLTSSRVDPASPRWQRSMQRFVREATRRGAGLAGAELAEQGAMQSDRLRKELAE